MDSKKTKTCVWDQEEEGWWATDCDNAFVFEDGNPIENGFKFCAYCGKKLVCKILEEVS